MVRGASWNNDTEINLRSSYRNNDHPTNRNDNNGFRCVLEVSGGKAPLQSVSPRCRAAIRRCPARGKKGSLTRTASPWRKTQHGGRWQPAGAREKTQCPPVAWLRAGSRAARCARLHPSACHSPDLIQLRRNEKQLTGRDPAAGLDDPPENAQLFQDEIEGRQFPASLFCGRESCGNGSFQGFNRQHINPLPEGETLALRKTSGSIEAPAEQFFDQGDYGRRF